MEREHCVCLNIKLDSIWVSYVRLPAKLTLATRKFYNIQNMVIWSPMVSSIFWLLWWGVRDPPLKYDGTRHTCLLHTIRFIIIVRHRLSLSCRLVGIINVIFIIIVSPDHIFSLLLFWGLKFHLFIHAVKLYPFSIPKQRKTTDPHKCRTDIWIW